MSNGKPGDHPLTDALARGSEFGPSVDALVRELSRLKGYKSVQGQIAYLLESLSPFGRPEGQKQALVEEALEKLTRIKHQLEMFQ
jgi:hypothetical protein